MTSFEFYSLLISTLAVAISAVALIRTRTLSNKQIELEQITADLSQYQLREIRVAELEKTKAYIDLELINNGPNNQYLYIKNTGQSEAINVKLNLLGDESPFLEGEFNESIPIKTLKPGKQVGLWFSDEIKPIYSYDFEVTWVNPDGETKSDKHTIHLN